MKKLLLMACLCYVGTLAFAQPANDLCANAIALTIGTDVCSFTIGNNTSATDSGELPTPSCASYSGGDLWYTIMVPASGSVTVDMGNAGGFTDSGMSIYSGTCGGLAEIECDDDDSADGLFSMIELTGQTPGAVLYVRVWEFGNNTFGDFNICAFGPAPPPPTPVNDVCSGAVALPVGTACSFTIATNESTTDSGELPTPSCASYSGGDLWYTVTVPASGNVTVDMGNASGFTDSGMSIYSGTCGGLAEIECDDDDSADGLFSMIALTGQTPGATLYVRVWEFGNNVFGDFNICAYEPVPPPMPPACGANPAPGNTCDVATMIATFDGYCGTTDATYTADTPGDLAAEFCGSMDNNSFLTFEVESDPVTIEFWVTGPGDCTDGPQFQFFTVDDCNAASPDWTTVPIDYNITDENGNTVIMDEDDCINDQAYGQGTYGMITIDGVTPGEIIYLMIDGWAGDVCDYVFAADGGVVPVELLDLAGTAKDKVNTIAWKTASERNTQWHVVERSINGQDKWLEIGREKAAGESLQTLSYQLDDTAPVSAAYYRLRTIDWDGSEEISHTIYVARDSKDFEIAQVAPVPTKDFVTVDYISTRNGDVKVALTDMFGKVVLERNQLAEKGANQVRLDLQNISNGFYVVTFDNGTTRAISRIVKQ